MGRDTFRAISLGAGVQSTTMVLMAVCGEFCPQPDCAIFADTGWEPPEVYRQLEKLEDLAKASGFPVHRCSAGDIRQDHLDSAGDDSGRSFMPFFVLSENGAHESHGIVRRKCSTEYKLSPVKRKIKELLGFDPRKPWPRTAPHIEQWIGFSTDEAQRCKPAPESWITTVFPLIEFGMSRSDCVQYCNDVGFGVPVGSSCIGCPFHSPAYWARMAKERPDEFEDACRFDEEMRERGGLPGIRGVPYLHSSRKPLRDVAMDYGGGEQLDLLEHGCGGMCDT